MMRLAWLDYLASLRERKTWLVAAMLVYAVVSIPVLLERPPPHVTDAVRAWLGAREPFDLFMYVWIDLTMNKVLAFVPVVLASGVVLRDRDRGVLAVLAAKPITRARYFVLRTASACAVLATLYVLGQGLGALWFAHTIPGFRPATFFGAMALHLLAGLFGTAFAAMLGVAIGRRGPAALVGFVVLSSFSGMALVGFYQPAWRPFALLNPYALGAQGLGALHGPRLSATLPAALALTAMTAAALGAGARLARRLEV